MEGGQRRADAHGHTTSTASRAVAGAFVLRAALLVSPALIVWPGEAAGWALAVLAAGAIQFVGAASAGLREQRMQEELYVSAGRKIADTSAMVPLPLPEIGPELALGRALFSRARLNASVRPTILGEGAALAAALLCVAISSQRLALLPLGAGVIAAGGLYVLLHRAALAREAVVQDRFTDLYGCLALFLAERQERVAQGVAGGFVGELERRAASHRRAATSAMGVRTLVRRVPLAAAILVVLFVGRTLGIAPGLGVPQLLVAAMLAQGGAAVFAAIAEQSQLARHAEPLDALLAMPGRPTFGETAPGPCERIEGRDVHFAYDEGGREVVTGVSFDVRKGQPLVLRGENGSGKSTLLRLLCGLSAPTSGTIRIDGIDIRTLAIDAFRARVAFVSQQTHFDPNATVADAMRALDPDVPDAAVRRALEMLGFTELPALFERPMGTLSSGQRRRVQLARAFALERPLLLLDEPEAGLDAATQRKVREIVGAEAGKRLVVVATHSDLFEVGLTLRASVAPLPVAAAS